MAVFGGNIGAGELAGGVDMLGLSPALLSMAISLPFGLASLLLCCEMPFVSLESPPLDIGAAFSPPFHDGNSQTTPVKLLTANDFLFHLRHGLPDLSRARRPALIAPWLALGPSLCAAPAPLVTTGLVPVWSMVPSSLWIVSLNAVEQVEEVLVIATCTYNLGFFLGPGLPRGFGVPLSSAICSKLLLLPASEPPLRFFETSPFEFSAASVPLGAGVDADSEALSLISGTFRVVVVSGCGAGSEVTGIGDGSSDLTGSSWKRRRFLGESLSTTNLAFFLLLSARFAAEGDRVLEGDIVV